MVWNPKVDPTSRPWENLTRLRRSAFSSKTSVHTACASYEKEEAQSMGTESICLCVCHLCFHLTAGLHED